MKKFICILLMLFLAFPAMAEDSHASFAPFELLHPGSVTVEHADGSCTFIQGDTRVVALVIQRVPDEDPAAAILRLLGQFDPDAVVLENVPTAEGFTGVLAATQDKYGEGVDQFTFMILSHEGALLILSGYNMAGDGAPVRSLAELLLQGLTVDGAPVVHTTK